MKKITFLLKSEVADLYDISNYLLISWIEEYHELNLLMKKYGYNRYQKLFTVKQVELLFEYIYLPDKIDKRILDADLKIPIRAYTKRKIANFYNITKKTLKNTIKNIEFITFLAENTKKKYDHSEISMIFKFIGHPKRKIIKKEEE